MRILLAVAMALGLLTAATGAAAQATYTFQGGLYDGLNNSAGCTVGDCATYTTAQRATATVILSAPLAPNLVNADVSGQVTSFTTNDGVRTTTGPGANGSIYEFSVTTDGAGALIDYEVLIERTPGPPYLVSTPADPNSRIGYVQFSPASSRALSTIVCFVRGPSAAGSSAGNCTSGPVDANTSQATSSAPTTVSAPAPATVPTMSEWAMILFGLLLAGGATVMIQRRRLA